MTAERPFTPETLADRWGCSAETVRQLVKAGRLRGFRVGRMFRIPAVAVEDCHWLMIPTPCVGSVANFAPLRVNALRRAVANACRQRGTRGWTHLR